MAQNLQLTIQLNNNFMQNRKLIPVLLLLTFTTSLAFCQSEVFKPVVNNLARFKQKKDLKFLAAAKKSIDSLITNKSDSANLTKSVYRVVVYTSIVYTDTSNTLKMPADFLPKTIQLVDRINANKKSVRYADQMDYANRCLADVFIRQGFKYLAILDYTNGKQAFLKAQKYTPKYKRLNFYLAYCNNRLGNLQDAANYYNDAIGTDTSKAEYVENTANIYKTMGDTAKAIALLQKGRDHFPEDRFLLLNLANIYNNQQNYIALASLLPQLLDNYPNNADIAFVAANCYDHLNQYDKAEVLYLKAINLNGSAYEPVLNLGLLYLKIGLVRSEKGSGQHMNEAVTYLEKADEISPNEINGLKALQLAYTCTQNNNGLLNVNDKLKQLTNQ
ncbi:MAG: tetratricopeptide repeat protein [Mucilaginibacter sp.]